MVVVVVVVVIVDYDNVVIISTHQVPTSKGVLEGKYFIIIKAIKWFFEIYILLNAMGLESGCMIPRVKHCKHHLRFLYANIHAERNASLCLA